MSRSLALSRCCLAILGALTLAPASANVTRPTAPAQSPAHTQTYLAILDTTLPKDMDSASRLRQITTSQRQLTAALAQLDPSIEVTASGQQLDDSLTLQMTPAQAAKVSKLPGIARLAPAGERLPSSLLLGRIAGTVSAAAQATPPLLATPSADDGKGVRVAILSTGIDYTHALLGGAGTEAAYNDAVANANAPYDGFPTQVVVAGRDFVSDTGNGADLNPIDQNLTLPDANGENTFPTGRGTLLASIVHEQAPGAELMAAKIYGINANAGFGPSLAQLTAALEWARDPNQDGDTSDGADIIVLDLPLPGHGIYVRNELSVDSYGLWVDQIQKAAAGALLITDQGNLQIGTRYATPYNAAPPSVMSVGSAYSEDDSLKVDSTSVHGPVRGDTDQIKPDLVSYSVAVEGAMVGGATATTTSPTQGIYGAARVAAAAAVLKSQRPALAATELRALLDNTADHQVLTPDGQSQAEVTWIGHGVENLAKALASPVVAWDASSYLSGINFGMQDVGPYPTTLSRQLYLRNDSSADVTYQLSATALPGTDQQALTWRLPASVTVPAGRAVLVPVSVTIDGAKLPAWPMVSGDNAKASDWRATEMDGYLTLSSDDQPTLNLAWLLRARPKGDIQKEFSTYTESFGNTDYAYPAPSAIGEATFPDNYAVLSQNFTNNTDHAQTYVAYATVAHRTAPPENLTMTEGHVMQAIGSGVFDDQRCTSGKKLSVAVSTFNRHEVALASYFDRGSFAFAFSLYNAQFTQDNAELPANQIVGTDADEIINGWVYFDDQGIPRAYYDDLTLAFDPSNPTARYRVSKLPVLFGSDARNMVAEYCLEDMAPWGIVPDDLNANLGYIVGTDRDVMPGASEHILQFNPVNMGPVVTTTVTDWFGNDVEQQTNLANVVLMKPASAEDLPANYQHQIVLAPGESATLAGVRDGNCAFDTCGDGFLLLGLEGDFRLWSQIRLGDVQSTVSRVRAGQQFSVAEHTASDTVIGQIALDAYGFFEDPLLDYNGDQAGKVSLMTSLPGDPIRIDDTGVIRVNNPAALDFALSPTLTFDVQVQRENMLGDKVPVTLHVTDVNENPPALADGASTSFSFTPGSAISLDLATLMTDADGDNLRFSASELPSGLSLSAAGLLSGTLASGQHALAVMVSDGTNTTALDLTLTVADTPAPGSEGGSGGGSFGALLLTFCALAGLRRRR